MSRMTKFLRQVCSLEKLIEEEEGQPKLNDFGEFQYEAPLKLKCRHEIQCKDVQTANGSIMRSTSVYYLDAAHKIRVDYRIDGKVVLNVREYVNALGICEGYEVHV